MILCLFLNRRARSSAPAHTGDNLPFGFQQCGSQKAFFCSFHFSVMFYVCYNTGFYISYGVGQRRAALAPLCCGLLRVVPVHGAELVRREHCGGILPANVMRSYTSTPKASRAYSLARNASSGVFAPAVLAKVGGDVTQQGEAVSGCRRCGVCDFVGRV